MAPRKRWTTITTVDHHLDMIVDMEIALATDTTQFWVTVDTVVWAEDQVMDIMDTQSTEETIYHQR